MDTMHVFVGVVNVRPLAVANHVAAKVWSGSPAVIQRSNLDGS